MRPTLLLVALVAGCGSSTNVAEPVVQTAALATATFSVDGMTCASCEVSIRTAAGKLHGVHSVEVDYATGAATVRYDPAQVSPAAIADAITDLGYPTTTNDGA